MRVLDIDLDFFLADCCPLAELGHRPSLPGHEPWEASAVRAFLENQCGLSRTAPKPGRIFETHDGALRFWEEQIAAGRLTAPFDVTHVDAHSDLGIGYPGQNFVLFNVLSMPVPKRLDYAPSMPRRSSMRRITCFSRWRCGGFRRWITCAIRVRGRIFRKCCLTRTATSISIR